MNEKIRVWFYNRMNGTETELEIPLYITANELIIALNKAYDLGMDTENIVNCSLAAENPIAFLRGNKMLSEFGLHNGSKIIFKLVKQYELSI